MPSNHPRKSLPRSRCADRRREERYPSGQDAACHPASHLDTTPVTVKDVSTRGVGLVSARPFEPGTVLVLELGETAPRPAVLLARVVRIVALPDGFWRAGCVFLSEISEEEFAAFRAERKRPAAGGRRAGVRLSVHRVALCRPAGVGRLGKWVAEIRDASPGGLAVLLPVPVEPGVKLRLEIPPEEDEPARTELVRVVHCQIQPDGRWLLGCQVIPGPPRAAAAKAASASRRK